MVPAGVRPFVVRVAHRSGVVALGVTALTLALATPATAADATLAIAVTGEVGTRCGFDAASGSRTIALDPNSTAWKGVDLRVDCNAPFRVRMDSTHNFRVRLDEPQASRDSAERAGFATTVPYAVKLAMDVQAPNGTTDVLQRQCNATLAPTNLCPLSDRNGVSSGERVAIRSGATVSVRLEDAIDPGRHAAGLYTDTITITVEARG